MHIFRSSTAHTGQHPCYPGVRMDGTTSATDLRMAIPESTGAFLRTAGGPDGTTLCLRSSEEVMSSKAVCTPMRTAHVSAIQASLCGGHSF